MEELKSSNRPFKMSNASVRSLSGDCDYYRVRLNSAFKSSGNNVEAVYNINQLFPNSRANLIRFSQVATWWSPTAWRSCQGQLNKVARWLWFARRQPTADVLYYNSTWSSSWWLVGQRSLCEFCRFCQPAQHRMRMPAPAMHVRHSLPTGDIL